MRTRYSLYPDLQATPRVPGTAIRKDAVLHKRRSLSSRLVRVVVRRLAAGRPWLVQELAEDDPDLGELIDAGEEAMFEACRQKKAPCCDSTVGEAGAMLDRPFLDEERSLFGEDIAQAAKMAKQARREKRHRQLGYLLVDELLDANAPRWQSVLAPPPLSPDQKLLIANSLTGLFSILARNAQMEMSATDLGGPSDEEGCASCGGDNPFREGSPFGGGSSCDEDDPFHGGTPTEGQPAAGDAVEPPWNAAEDDPRWVRTCINGQLALNGAGAFEIALSPTHAFWVDSVLFDGSTPDVRIERIVCGDSLRFDVSDGIPARRFFSCFSDGPLSLKDIVNKAALKPGEKLIVRGTAADAHAEVMVAFDGWKRAIGPHHADGGQNVH